MWFGNIALGVLVRSNDFVILNMMADNGLLL